MSNEIKILIGIGVATLAILIGGAYFISSSSSPSSTDTPSEQANVELLVRPDSFSTNPEAKLLVVEFGDYQCPACASANPTVARIIEEYNEDVNFVFRHYPLPQHRNAKQAAYSAEAAGLQGKFWEMHDKLYENQSEWSEEGNPSEYFEKYATDLKLDLDKFRTDVKSDVVKDKVERDKGDAVSLGVSSTPTFYINGYEYKGALSFSQFEQLIKEYKEAIVNEQDKVEPTEKLEESNENMSPTLVESEDN